MPVDTKKRIQGLTATGWRPRERAGEVISRSVTGFGNLKNICRSYLHFWLLGFGFVVLVFGAGY
jgi:hypothetical protein